MTESILFNCSARIEKNDAGQPETKGNVTEQGIIKFFMDLGVDCAHEIRKKEDKILELIPFNSRRKKACTVVRHPDD
jgi:magnesium-transporting ATPase (P-type)